MNCQRLNASSLTGIFALLFAICGGQVFAQASGGGYTINKSVFAGGGGTSTNGTTQITGTAGQRAARVLSDGTNTIASGFWNGVTCMFSNSGGDVITPAILSNASAGQSYSQMLVGNGSIGPYTFLVMAGAVPNGMSLGSFGVLSGTPTAAGASNFTVTVTDGFGCTAMQNFSLTVGCPTITVNNPMVNAGFVGIAFSQSFTQTGGGEPTTFSTTSTLPAGLTLSAAGLLSGTPTEAGTFPIIVKATDFNDCMGTGAAYTLTLGTCGSITVTPTTLLNGLIGISFAQTLSATGGSGSYTFSLASGNLPTGLGLSNNMIVGTPTTAGASTFTIRATDNNSCFSERTYTVVIGSTGLMYYPLTRPVRLLDTRKGASPNACNQPNAQITGGSSLTITARGTCDGVAIPANATTLTGHATMVQPSGNGFLTMFPGDVPQPTVASSNFLATEVLNNAFTVGLGAADGALKIFVTATSHVVIDVTGYYAPPTIGGLYFHPLPKPIRLLETRTGFTGCQTTGTPLQAGSTRLQSGVLTCDGVAIPTGALALIGNATTTNTISNGYLTLYPADAMQPFIASSNYVAGINRNAPFTVGLSSNGEFKIFTAATTDLVIDVMGYYSAQASDTNGQGLLYNSLGSPLRLMDTRAGQSACYAPGAPMTGGTVYTQETQVPCSNLTAAARGLVGNVSTVNTINNGFLTFWPSNIAQPTTATSNYQTGRVFNRHFTVGLGPDAAFKRATSSTTDLIIDISGFFAP